MPPLFLRRVWGGAVTLKHRNLGRGDGGGEEQAYGMGPSS